MRTIGIAMCCALVAGALVQAQDQQTPTPPFKGGVSLVTVDVTVLDRDGKPVPGLTSSDFQVKLNGKAQPVRALTYLEALTVASESAPDPKAPVMPQMFPVAEVRGGDSSTGNESRVFVILVDDLSFPALGGRALFTAAQRFVTGLPAADLVGFATSSGPGAVNPTRDRAPVSAALAAVVGEYNDPRSIDRGSPAGKEAGPDQSLGISQSLDIDRGDHAAFERAILNECYHGDTSLMPKVAVESLVVGNKCASDLQVQARRTAALTRQTTERQVGAFQSVIRAMKEATGIKHLLLITEGVGITFDATSLQPVARAAADAGIQLSVVVEEPGLSLSDTGRRDEGGGAKPSIDAGMSQRRREDNAMFVTGAHTLADMVGGAFYRVIGSADPFFQRVALASSAVYRLAVEPPADATPGKDFSLVATVKRSGLTALTNKRAMATAPDAAAASTTSLALPKAAAAKGVVTVDDQLRAAMNAGRAFDGVPLTMTSAVRRAAAAGQLEIGIRVQIPATAKGPLTAVFGVVDEAGKLRSGRRVIDAPPEGESYGLTFAIPVAPGPYRLRFAVADASGHVGAVEKAVRAELASMGPFAVGDLRTSWLDAEEKEQADFPPSDDLPAAAKTLSVSLELFQLAGAAVPRDILVKVTFGTIERIVVPSSDSGIWRAEAQFSLDRVTAGSYPIEATVMVEGKAVGSRSAVVKKRSTSGAKLER